MALNLKQRVFTSLIIFAVILSLGSQSYAQGQESARALGGPRRQLATIIFAGLGGSILGLSTLSFYGRPQDKLSNIAIGFAVGVIAGTSYVTYKAATNPSEFYGVTSPWLEKEMSASSRYAVASETTPLRYDFNWSF